MPYILGIDTGGTFTDGAIVRFPEAIVLHQAKTPTTHDNLCDCIRNCIRSFDPTVRDQIRLVSLSTTLATNALVEGRGCTEGLILIGGRPEGRLPTEHIRVLPGKPDILGRIQQPLDPALVDEAIESFRGKVQSIAVSGYASIRNPAHEIYVRDRIRQLLGIPVVCAHELTGALGFLDRTVTAALNARLIPLLCSLIDAVRQALLDFSIHAPLFIVRGDGMLMSAEQACERPIETILSGPAASIAGGRFLSGLQDALILDMGGTTTDLANISNGAVPLRANGANIGGWFTQVRAAEVYTIGLGGDSRIQLNSKQEILVGPERAIPFCVAAHRFPTFSHELLTLCRSPQKPFLRFWQNDAEGFLLRHPFTPESENEQHLLEALQSGPHTLFNLREQTGLGNLSVLLDRLIAQGFVMRIALTPTDLLHADGSYVVWDDAAAKHVIALWSELFSISHADCLCKIRSAVERKLASACLQAGFYFDGQNPHTAPAFTRYVIDHLMLDHSSSLLDISSSVRKKIVTIGAPAEAWTACLRAALHTQVISPVHAQVAGAVGAAIGQLLERTEVLIRPDPVTKQYTVFSVDNRRAFSTLEQATAFAQSAGQEQTLRRLPNMQGDTTCEIDDIYTDDPLTAEKIFIERRIRVVATAPILGNTLP